MSVIFQGVFGLLRPVATSMAIAFLVFGCVMLSPAVTGGACRVLAAPPQEHTVESGDTIWGIAQQYGVTVSALTAANSLSNPDLISVGQVIKLPVTRSTIKPKPVLRAVSPSSGSILETRRLLTYYGNPYSELMGILGQLSHAELVAALERRASIYEAAGGKPVQPAIHLVAIVAQDSPGNDGRYRAKMPDSVIQEYADLAARNGMLLILDIQVGRSTVQKEIATIRHFLELPHVHLALDPEFDMWGDQVPGQQIGSTRAVDINYAQRILADIVAKHGYSNKILIVHQFTSYMIRNKSAIEENPLVDVAIVMDGFGGREIKTLHYNMFVRDEPVEYGGIKLFFDQDTNLMLPEDVMALEPEPDIIVYQ